MKTWILRSEFRDSIDKIRISCFHTIPNQSSIFRFFHHFSTLCSLWNTFKIFLWISLNIRDYEDRKNDKNERKKWKTKSNFVLFKISWDSPWNLFGNFYCKMPICLFKNKGIKCIFGMLVKSCRMEGNGILENKVHVFVVFSLLFQRDYHYFIFFSFYVCYLLS